MPELRERVLRFTVAHYERLTELGEFPKRAELIRGVIVEKTPKSPLHNFLTHRLNEYLEQRAKAGRIVRQEATLRLEDSVPEPDVAVVQGTWADFRSRHPTTAELVVEVAISSAALDRENASLYAGAGVTAYWIVLGSEEQIEVYREPVDGSYQSRRVYERGETIEGVAAVDGPVPVAELFA